MSKPTLSEAHIIGSIAGEEDPGASLDVVRDLIARHKPLSAAPALRPAPQQIPMDCAEDDEAQAFNAPRTAPAGG